MSVTRTYHYTVDERGMSFPDDVFKFKSEFRPDDPEWIAEDAAEDFHSNHDGWESSWPVTIEISYEGKILGRFSVDMEARPHFTASVAKEEPRA